MGNMCIDNIQTYLILPSICQVTFKIVILELYYKVEKQKTPFYLKVAHSQKSKNRNIERVPVWSALNQW